MIIPYKITIIGILCLLSSCTIEEEHEGFMSISDLLVYKKDVKVENYDFGRVEFIDTNNLDTSSYIKNLIGIYLLYIDSLPIAVYNQHPKDNIKLIENLAKMYQTDTTRLSVFVKFDSTIRLTVNRLCKDRTREYYFGKYETWRVIEYAGTKEPYKQTKNELITWLLGWRE